ncbi:MAG: hypothetical protein RL499_1547 [Actinomycetota bacterium]|jgi:methionine-rich copper-binding protein CopC
MSAVIMTRRGTSAVLATAAVALGLVLGAAAPAFAHNHVVSSTPEEGETLTAVPGTFVITTNDALLNLSGEASGFGMVIADANGLYYGDGCVTIDGRSMSTRGALGPAGDYTLTFQLISADGHTLSDTIAFRYEPTDTVTVQGGADSPPVCPGAEGSTGEGASDPSADASRADAESAIVLTIVAFVLAALAAVSAIITSAVITRNRRAAHDEPPTPAE